MKPERWSNPENKLFPYQVGSTSPPHDFDAAPSDFLRIAPESVGVHGRMLHVPNYEHQLSQRVDNFHLLEEFVHCISNNGVDVCGQVGTNWVHCQGTTPDEIREICERISDKYETPFHMAGYCLVEALRELNVEKIALNSVYYWPDWRNGNARFLKEAGFDLIYYGNFVDQGFYATQQKVNDLTWIFPGDLAVKSMLYMTEQALDADAIVVNGMPNFRRGDGMPQRIVSIEKELESATGKTIVSSDTALYWRIFKALNLAPTGDHGRLLSTLSWLVIDMHKILVLWATPRSTSTAFEWMMRMRGDMTCFHEPFGEPWYQGEEPLWPRITSKSPRTPGLTFDSVWEKLKAAAKEGPVFSKDFPHYVEHMWTDNFLSHFYHSFLIRDPAKVATSMYKHWPDFVLKEIAFVEQRTLFDRLADEAGEIPPVIDSDDLLENPHGIVEAYCDPVGIPYMPEALNWELGERKEVSWYDGGSWHGNLRESDGLKPQRRQYIDISEAPDRVRDIYETCLPHYERLYRYRLESADSEANAKNWSWDLRHSFS